MKHNIENPIARKPESNIDSAFGSWLADQSPLVSRRNFFNRSFKFLAALTGVSVVSRILPFTPPSASAQICNSPPGTGIACAQRGYNCTSTAGLHFGGMWVQCCKVTVASVSCWMLCTYKDYCTDSRTVWGNRTDYQGNFESSPLGENDWCVPGGFNYYICTTHSCSGHYASSSQCRGGGS